MYLVELVAVFFVLFLFALLAFAVLKRIVKMAIGFITNAILGITALIILNLLGAGIGINLVTVAICAVFGLLGVAILLVLKLLGLL